jgi:hypothetical protein
MPEWLYFVFAAFVIVGTVNAVNLTDGIDGLAAGTSMPVCLFFVTVTFPVGKIFLTLGIFASGLLGGLLGFLVYNFNPAKVFMGDTGSLFLGGAIAAMAFAYDMPADTHPAGDNVHRGDPVRHYTGHVFQALPRQARFQDGALPPPSGDGRLEREKSGAKSSFSRLYTLITLAMAIVSFIGVYGRYR